MKHLFDIFSVPNKPEDASLSYVTSTEAMVAWKLPDGKFDHIKLTLTTSDGQTDPKIVTQTGTSYTLLALQPGTQYTLNLQAQSGELYSEAVAFNFTTSKFIRYRFSNI